MTDLGPYSPVTFNGEWSRTGRLTLILFLSIFGTIMNGFFVASFFINRVLRKSGNVFLCSQGLADMIVTSVDMPIIIVILISGQWDTMNVCKFLHFITEISTYCYSMLAMMVAFESYNRTCCSKEAYKIFSSIPRILIFFIICTTSSGMSCIGVYYKQDYDYCERKHHGNASFRCFADLLFFVTPGFITLVTLTLTLRGVHRKFRTQRRYRRSHQYKTDRSLTKLNILNYCFFVSSWIPYLTLVYYDPDTASPLYYFFVWFALIRSCFTTVMYGIKDKNFRKSFSQIYNYCFCKKDLTSSLNRRHRRRRLRGVRVQMMHQMTVSGRSQRNIGSSLYATSEL